ncbi:MAG TPA: hypothetical protein P5275_20070 [Saprospiraceae bacterium]|nr:hypothetical protein [Lewinellaceae bacterium]HPG09716.1 hypothetical protein [Saprospiraceae bacterium]HPQ99769.1 hypothetical protein [Saprospiraceae bacterium]HQU52554.1 hypothetical protein [Saprospiraceae bacterium]HRV87179.1 hypothetical protein [Saprospiraceae bacterium]
MKKSALFLALSLTMLTGLLAQSNTQLFTAEIKKGDVPQEVLKAIEKDFPKMIANHFQSIPGEIVAGSFVLNGDESDANQQTYQIYLKGDHFNASALYDNEGNLVSAREFYKNKALPESVAKAVGNLYPGWTLNSDFERITINKDDMTKPYYRILLKKGNEKMRLTIDESGHEMSKHQEKNM